MHQTRLRSGPLFLLLAGLFCLWAGQAVAQTTDGAIEGDTEVTNPQPPATGDVVDPDGDVPEPDDPAVETPDATNPPPFMAELLEITGLTQEKVDQMRTSGMGWGEIRIATRLAEQMAAGSDGVLTFDDTLAEVLAAREAGQGFGQIAGEHNLTIGQLARNDRAEAAVGKRAENAAAEATEVKAAGKEKAGLFARIGRFLGFGKPEQPGKPADVEKPMKPERPERASKPGRPERPVAVERSVASARPEVPSRPERPSKPEKPNRGPDR
jgi:hypothetical protein